MIVEDVPIDSGIEGDTSSADSAPGTISPDRDESECRVEVREEATLEEVDDMILDKAVGSLMEVATDPVVVMDRDGKSMVLQMPQGATVGEILARAADADDIPDNEMYRYRLMNGNTVLDQGKTLAQQASPGTVLRLEEGEMDLNIKRLDGKHFQVRTLPTTTVAEFRRQLQIPTGIQPAEQRLLFTGKTLADGKKLSDYKVKNGATLELVTRCHSG